MRRLREKVVAWTLKSESLVICIWIFYVLIQAHWHWATMALCLCCDHQRSSCGCAYVAVGVFSLQILTNNYIWGFLWHLHETCANHSAKWKPMKPVPHRHETYAPSASNLPNAQTEFACAKTSGTDITKSRVHCKSTANVTPEDWNTCMFFESDLDLFCLFLVVEHPWRNVWNSHESGMNLP